MKSLHKSSCSSSLQSSFASLAAVAPTPLTTVPIKLLTDQKKLLAMSYTTSYARVTVYPSSHLQPARLATHHYAENNPILIDHSKSQYSNDNGNDQAN